MCGIVGYIGKRPAVGFLLEGLRRLEYRGYDSAGVATVTPAEGIRCVKTNRSCSPLSGCCGTTWLRRRPLARSGIRRSPSA